jgi:hypothetical protein
MDRRLFLLPLTLLLLLSLAGTAAAAPAIPPILPPVLPPGEPVEAEGEAGEAEEECEAAEAEEGLEECEEELLGGGGPLPEECLLRTASARLLTSAAQDAARLTITYTASSPTEVFVTDIAAGAKGPVTLGHARRRFSQKGVFSAVQHLSPGAMAKVRAAKSVTVKLDVPAAPGECDGFYSLPLKRSSHSSAAAMWAGSI